MNPPYVVEWYWQGVVRAICLFCLLPLAYSDAEGLSSFWWHEGKELVVEMQKPLIAAQPQSRPTPVQTPKEVEEDPLESTAFQIPANPIPATEEARGAEAAADEGPAKQEPEDVSASEFKELEEEDEGQPAEEGDLSSKDLAKTHLPPRVVAKVVSHREQKIISLKLK